MTCPGWSEQSQLKKNKRNWVSLHLCNHSWLCFFHVEKCLLSTDTALLASRGVSKTKIVFLSFLAYPHLLKLLAFKCHRRWWGSQHCLSRCSKCCNPAASTCVVACWASTVFLSAWQVITGGKRMNLWNCFLNSCICVILKLQSQRGRKAPKHSYCSAHVLWHSWIYFIFWFFPLFFRYKNFT
jgi:hypothetical protein